MKAIFGICVVASALLSTPLLAQAKGDQDEYEKRTFMSQFIGKLPTDIPGYSNDSQFVASLKEACEQSPDAQRLSTPGGVILLDWLAKRVVSGVNKKLERYIKEHTATYSNKPQYGDIGEAGLWRIGKDNNPDGTRTYESCVLVTRLTCPKEAAEKENWGRCTTRLRFAAIMREEKQSLRVLPVAISIDGLEARHSKGKAAVGVNFEVQAISHSKLGGQRWSSGDVPLILEEFVASKTNPGKQEYGAATLFKAYPVSKESWGEAPLLPMPPNLNGSRKNRVPTMGALKVTVAQVGRPSAFGKRLADLLSTKEDDLAGALGSALKKAAGVDEE